MPLAKSNKKYQTKKHTKKKRADTKPKNALSISPLHYLDTVRLNRYIANSGVCSRREADKLIAEGLIRVNGTVITAMGYQVNPHKDRVNYRDKLIYPERMTYILLNKPKDYITTTQDPEGRKTVMNLVKNSCEERIYPVGRLDRNTTGLLLFTNDGELAKKLAHPSGRVRKIYLVELNKPITEMDFQKITTGFALEDGPIDLDGISVVSPDNKSLGVELHSGKNRIVKRIFEHLGYEVVKLDRTVYGGLTKHRLPRGKWRTLTTKELKQFKS